MKQLSKQAVTAIIRHPESHFLQIELRRLNAAGDSQGVAYVFNIALERAGFTPVYRDVLDEVLEFFND